MGVIPLLSYPVLFFAIFLGAVNFLLLPVLLTPVVG